MMELDKVKQQDEIIEFDYNSMKRSDLKAMLFNQLMKQAMSESPQPSILTMAIKLVGVDGSDSIVDQLSDLSTDELVVKIKKLM